MEWISIEDSLPVCIEPVNIQRGNGFVSSGYLSVDGSFFDAFCREKTDEVTHWMPLPKPLER